MKNPKDTYTQEQILEANRRLQSGNQESAYDILQELLNRDSIFLEM